VDLLRVALANLRFPATPEESVTLATQAIEQASISVLAGGIVDQPQGGPRQRAQGW